MPDDLYVTMNEKITIVGICILHNQFLELISARS
jgi:hypothetical protein